MYVSNNVRKLVESSANLLRRSMLRRSKDVVFLVLLSVCTKKMVEICKSYTKISESEFSWEILMGIFSWEFSHGKFSVDGPL